MVVLFDFGFGYNSVQCHSVKSIVEKFRTKLKGKSYNSRLEHNMCLLRHVYLSWFLHFLRT